MANDEQGKFSIELTARQISDMYKKRPTASNISILVKGEEGVGKTTLAFTARKPILGHLFDPHGHIVINQTFPEDVENGNILIETFTNDSHKDPKAFREWEKRWELYRKTGFFNKLGTYVIDSGTYWVEALSNEVSKSNKLDDGLLEIGDYKVIYQVIKTHIKMMSEFSCDFIMTFHTVNVKDEVTGAVMNELDAYKGLRGDIPRLFAEKWIVERKGDDVSILMKPVGRFKASTQIGSRKFEGREGANVKGLLKKAGMEYRNKPPLFDPEEKKEPEKEPAPIQDLEG